MFTAVEQELARLEAIFSLYDPNSQLSRLNAEGQLAAPAPELLEVLSLSGSLNDSTGGVFNPAVQPLWQAHARAELDGRAATDAEIVDAVTRMDACRSQMLSFMESYDVILCPVNALPAMNHGSEDGENLRPFSYTMTYNLTGWPGAVVRGGTSPEGLPIGIQVVGRPWREDIVLAVAQLLESELGGFQAADI